MKKLKPGDHVHYLSAAGRKLRGVVADALPFPRRRGEPELVPVMRPRNGVVRKCNADNITQPTLYQAHSNLKVKWINRNLLRKLPE